jgi:hypothetical protein
MSIARLDELKSLIARLQAERQQHVNAIEQIDQAFAGLGLHAAQPKKRGRGRGPAKRAVKQRRPRRKFKTTGAESILTLVKAAGAKGVAGGQIAKHWKAEGRGAGLYGLLGQLVKGKKIKRQKIKGQKGSMYTAFA